MESDSLNISIMFRRMPLDDPGGGFDRFFPIVDLLATGLSFDRVYESRSARYSKERIRKLFESASKKLSFSLTSSSIPGADLLFSMSDQDSPPFWLHGWIPLSRFQEADGDRAVAIIVETVRQMSAEYDVTFGYGSPVAEIQLGSDPHRTNANAPAEVYEIHWLNVFGRELADRLGPDHLRATPGCLVDLLPNGAALLVAGPNPATFLEAEARPAQARALTYLRPDRDYDETLRTLLERSERLVPRSRQWDPKIADLLDLVLQDSPMADRQVRTEELNRYQPPEVTEILEGDAILPSDVDDQEEAIRHYGAHLAEGFIAVMHQYLPEIVHERPDILPKVDYHLWHFDYPAEFDRPDIENDLVPMIGAFLGQLLVDNLGGHWVPRRNIDESEVVIGDRAWLPFLRARHYMRDRQSVLDHSLTQFFRLAEESKQEA